MSKRKGSRGLRVADRVSDLLGRMTAEEKFGQRYTCPGDLYDPACLYSP